MAELMVKTHNNLNDLAHLLFSIWITKIMQTTWNTDNCASRQALALFLDPPMSGEVGIPKLFCMSSTRKLRYQCLPLMLVSWLF